MNKLFNKKKYILILFLCVFVSGTSFGQHTEKRRYMIIRTIPYYTLLVNINYNQSVLELAGTYNDDVRSKYIYEGETFGADKGYGGTIVSKISIGERGVFRFNQTIGYNRILSYAFGDKELADKGKANYNAFTGSLGLEYNFTPAHRFKIYLGAEITASIINGETSIWIDNPGYGYQNIGDFKIKNTFRMGYGFNAGSEYTVNKDFGLNLGVRFYNLNAFNKNAEGTNNDTEFKLRDKDSPGLNFAGNKNFAFFSLFGGVNFYFGIGEKRYKLK